MKYTNGQITLENRIIADNKQIINPTDEQLVEYGWSIYQPTNAEISEMRKEAYAKRSDHLMIAWQKNLALGNEDVAEKYKAEWLAEVEKINEELPYNEEEDATMLLSPKKDEEIVK